MHGIVFSAFRDYVTAEGGDALERRVFGGAPRYAMSEAYGDDEFAALVEAAASATGESVDGVLHGFGVFTGEIVFPRLYPAFYSIAGGPHTFLLTIETRIHELVRATIPNALPPRLRVAASGPDGVEILYDSPRRLCRLLEGLAIGTARHFGVDAEVREVECARDGGAHCRFDVRFAPPAAR